MNIVSLCYIDMTRINYQKLVDLKSWLRILSWYISACFYSNFIKEESFFVNIMFSLNDVIV